MTAEKKAIDLVDDFNKFDLSHFEKKQCALFCVDEMQEHAQMVEGEYEGYSNAYQFLLNVEQQINKL